MKVLFFVEPVVYRSDPRLLANWITVICRAAACSHGFIEPHLATSDTLLEYADPSLVGGWSLPSLAVLESIGFNRVAYMQDVCLGDGHANGALVDSLQRLKELIEPDVVISWTENAYVRRIFDESEILFTEFGPAPRTGFVSTIHLDPCGHQIGSVFDEFRDPRWEENDEDPSVSGWYRHWLAQIEITSEARKLKQWLETLPATRPRKLVALQPNDWLTYEGSGVATDPLGFLAAVAAKSDVPVIIIPQWHPAQVPPSEELLGLLCREYPFIAVPPEHLRVGHSECLLPHVDEVVTVSSNVAVAGALLGRRVEVAGRSKFSALATPASEPARRRADLIPVLASKLCRPIESWTEERGGLVNHIESAISWRTLIAQRPEFGMPELNRLLI